MRNRAGFLEQQLQAETAMKEGRNVDLQAAGSASTFSISNSDEEGKAGGTGDEAQGGGSGEGAGRRSSSSPTTSRIAM